MKRLAVALDQSPESLFETHLAWLELHRDPRPWRKESRKKAIQTHAGFLVPIPANYQTDPGQVFGNLLHPEAANEMTDDPHAMCQFHLANGKCAIHAIRPQECRAAFACGRQNPAQTKRYYRIRKLIERAWLRPAAAAFVSRVRARSEA